jgi:hypothetical protein
VLVFENPEICHENEKMKDEMCYCEVALCPVVVMYTNYGKAGYTHSDIVRTIHVS